MSDETCEHIWQHDFCGAGITICTKCNYVQGAEKKTPSALQKEKEKVRKLREALEEIHTLSIVYSDGVETLTREGAIAKQALKEME